MKRKNVFCIVFAAFLLFGTSILNGQQKAAIDLSSVDKFFEIADKVASNKDVSEEDWKDMSKTLGYRNRFAPYKVIPEMLIVAYSNNQQVKRDSILNLSWENTEDFMEELAQITLINFLDMKEHQKELKLFRETYDFDAIKNHSMDRLKSFLIYPTVDTLIVFPRIALLCQESEAQYNVIGGLPAIIMDFNKFYKDTEEERINFLAHEMFHSYRDNVRTKLANNDINSYLYWELSKLQNEGIADLIDKTEDLIKSYGLEGAPQEYIDLFVSSYDNTPQILNDLDVMTRSLINKEISEEQFNEKMEDFFLFNGHANGYYMAKLIKNAGYMDEMLNTFYSPVEFVKLYNKAAQKEQTYMFSDEFIKFVENL
ncbi:MAG: hypothetical protein LBU91_07770 [Bacteroidales bacterium]|jgi:hypothetical protein|nr:hypothetical protein [Bacteroidales bacterium]